MKATELKIGDWVYYCGKEKVAVRIAELELMACSIWEDEDFYGSLFYNDIEPIPLTGEILEKSGWEDYGFGVWRIKTPYGYLWLDAHYKGGKTLYLFSVGIKNDPNGVDLLDIRFVHELQHILWALGLGDNLEI